MPKLRALTKWAGGKTKAAPQIVDTIEEHDGFGSNRAAYVELFVGGGAVFTEALRRGLLDGKEAYVVDTNGALIAAWRALRSQAATQRLVERIMIHERAYQRKEGEAARRAFYDVLRDDFNQDNADNRVHAASAASLLWLIQHGYNGLYRESKDGRYNVPWNKDTGSPTAVESACENMVALARKITDAGVRLTALRMDFRGVLNLLDDSHPPSVVYGDPPYMTTDFKHYQSTGFTHEDHAVLQAVCHLLAKDGHKPYISNADSESARAMYAPNMTFPITDSTTVSRTADGRAPRQDLLVRIGGW